MDNLKYLEVPFKIKQIVEDDEFFIAEGLASTFGNLDRQKEVVERGAFTESLQKRSPVILFMHRHQEPLGMPIQIGETDAGLFVKFRMPKADTFVSGRVVPQMKVGSIAAMSIGFKVIEEAGDPQDPAIKRLIKVDLFEISLVTFPANPLAIITSIKSLAGRTYDWNKKDALARIKIATGSQQAPSKTYKDAFLWCDEQALEKFDSYKFPCADVIDGKVTIIPRALNHAKGLVKTASIPQEQKDKILADIKAYQLQLDKEQPKKMYTVDEVKQIDNKRDFENLLRDSGSFSKEAATTLAGKFNQGEPETTDTDAVTKALGQISTNMELSKAFNEILTKA